MQFLWLWTNPNWKQSKHMNCKDEMQDGGKEGEITGKKESTPFVFIIYRRDLQSFWLYEQKPIYFLSH